MGTPVVDTPGKKKLSGTVKGYLILFGLVVLSWLIFKILTPSNFGSPANMLSYFQASLIATVGAVGFYFVWLWECLIFSIGANIMLSAIVGCVFATRFNLGYFGLIVGCILTGTIVGALNDGLNGDPTMLIAKAILDGACLDSLRPHLSARRIPVYCADFLLSRRHYIDGTIHPSLADRCLDWSNVVCRLRADFAISLNLIFNSKLRVGNLLPAIFLPVLFFFLAQIFSRLSAPYKIDTV